MLGRNNKFTLVKFIFLLSFMLPTVGHASLNDTCSLVKPLIPTNQIETLETLAQHLSDLSQSNSSSSSSGGFIINNVQTCLNFASAGVKLNKTVSESIKCISKLKENPQAGLSHGLNATISMAKAAKLKVNTLKLPANALKLSNSKDLRDKLGTGAKLLATTAVLTHSFIPFPYVKQAGKVLVNGTNICKYFSCLIESETSTERLTYGLRTLGSTAALVDNLLPVPYMGTVADVLTGGTKVYKAAKSSYKIASKAAKKIYFKDPASSKWMNEQRTQFQISGEHLTKRTDSSFIECKYKGESFWAASLATLPGSPSDQQNHFQAKGRWITIKDGKKESSLIFALKVPKREVLQACKNSILMKQTGAEHSAKRKIEVDLKTINSDEISFSARSNLYTSPYSTAMSLHKNGEGLHTFTLIP